MVFQHKPDFIVQTLKPASRFATPNDFLSSLKVPPPFPDAEKLGSHMMKLFEKIEVKESFMELSPVLRDCITSKVWAARGRMQGIHNEFGLHSYLQTPFELPNIHYLHDEERVELIMQLNETFAGFFN